MLPVLLHKHDLALDLAQEFRMMKRKTISPRANWQDTLESQGFNFHTMDGQTYWNETAYYLFSKQEINILEQATQELHDLCLQAVEVIINRGWLHKALYSGMVYSRH
jgi:glutathionylspermidine synthase